jgi:hypothetical protein
MVTAGSGNSFKDRTFTDFDIDPLTLDAEGNDKVLDLIEENNTLTHEVPPQASAEDATGLPSLCVLSVAWLMWPVAVAWTNGNTTGRLLAISAMLAQECC